MSKCPNCNKEFSDESLFCNICETKIEEAPISEKENNIQDVENDNIIEDTDIQDVENSKNTENNVSPAPLTSNNSRPISKTSDSISGFIPVIVIFGVALSIILSIIIQYYNVDVKLEFVFDDEEEKDEIVLYIDDEYELSYTMTPTRSVTWSSSDESVAVVEQIYGEKAGRLIAKGNGECTITIKANSKSDEITVIVKEFNFLEEFSEYADEDWCEIGLDNSYIAIDTNPNDSYVSDSDEEDALAAIAEINQILGFPDVVSQKMSSAIALNGRETHSIDKYTVSWTYHPDNGLEVTYEINN